MKVKAKDVLGVVLMIAGIAGVFVGTTTGSGGLAAGWSGVPLGVAALALSYRVMRDPAARAREEVSVPSSEAPPPPTS